MTTTIHAQRVEAAEFVLPGHPDKLCDAFADAIVDQVMRGDALGQCGVEAACVFGRLFVTGRIAAAREVLDALDIDALARRTYREAGYGEDAAGRVWGPRPEDLRVDTALCFGEFEPGERELRHLSDDQAICVGYANAFAATKHLPPAHWLANRIGRELLRLRLEKGAGEVGPDGKVLVQVARDGLAWRAKRVSISLNHHTGSDWLLLRRIAEEAVETACAGRALPEIVVNGAGMFVAGGPNGDNGTTGKKLVIDAYGPTVPIGGGAWSGKDFNKVDRAGGFLARELALGVMRELAAEPAPGGERDRANPDELALGPEVLVTLGYEPGGAGPQWIRVEAGGAGGAREFTSISASDPHFATATVSARLRALAARKQLAEVARWGIAELEPSCHRVPASGPNSPHPFPLSRPGRNAFAATNVYRSEQAHPVPVVPPGDRR
ncbi:MAG: methionine adenosyltransferase domain-containing protein [Burkholderiaceae bacterium]|nr:methionine adenosyltransferase domain-containing protein [Burkholderiaceae bacterium]